MSKKPRTLAVHSLVILNGFVQVKLSCNNSYGTYAILVAGINEISATFITFFVYGNDYPLLSNITDTGNANEEY